jgi:two-component system cell cycle sensor histidine kinase/response regulator CckA
MMMNIAVKPKKRGGSMERLLLVEDDDLVRQALIRGLMLYNYDITSASSGAEAVTYCGEHAEPFDLLVTDVLMPGMNGVDLARQLLKTQRVARVLFVSGYPDDVVRQHLSWEATAHCLQKPFTPTELAQKIDEVLKTQPVRRDG